MRPPKMSDSELACDVTPWGSGEFVNALSDVRRAGYSGVEIGVELVPPFEDRVHILKEMLDAERLGLAAIRVPLRQLSGGFAEEETERCLNVVRFLRGMGCKLLVLTAPPAHAGSAEEEWLLFGSLVAEVCKRAGEGQARVALAPARGTICASAPQLAKVLRMKAASGLGVAVDSAYLADSRIAPAGFLRKHRRRLAYLYLSHVIAPPAKGKAKKKAKGKTSRRRRTGARPQRPVVSGGVKRFLDAATACKYSGWVTIRLAPPEFQKNPAGAAAKSFQAAAGALDILPPTEMPPPPVAARK